MRPAHSGSHYDVVALVGTKHEHVVDRGKRKRGGEQLGLAQDTEVETQRAAAKQEAGGKIVEDSRRPSV